MPGDIKQTSEALEKGRLQAGLDILGAASMGSLLSSHLWSCPEVDVQFVPIQSHKMRRNLLLLQKFSLCRWGEGSVSTGFLTQSPCGEDCSPTLPAQPSSAPS